MRILCPDKMPSGIECVTPFSAREITHAFHDIDGTHSLIRNWVPVMTLCTGFASHCLWDENITVPELTRLISGHSPEEYEEANRFSIESAGLSALTQMEWGIRNAIANGVRTIKGTTPAVNRRIIQRIWKGEELFDDEPETPEFRAAITALSDKLFRAYEVLLLQMGRDQNLAEAKRHPDAWRVPGSMGFLAYLRDHEVKNYFVTGAVIEYDAQGHPFGTMLDEVLALGYEIGPGRLIEKLVGSTWNEKLPKEQIMLNICKSEGISPHSVLVVGDGRSEISAGVKMGAVTISRLPKKAVRAREIHTALHTNLIIEQYDKPLYSKILV